MTLSREVSSHLRPPLKWAGGKRWLVPYLLPLWAAAGSQRLVEPFCGGLAVALGLMPGTALLNDANPHLINFYRWLKAGFTEGIPTANTERGFYERRDRFNRLLKRGGEASAEAGALFYYLNRTCYNGLCRFNRSGEFNVPYGKYRSVNYHTDLTRFKDAFAAWSFCSGDFEEIALRQTDFVYADPPYDVQFTQYARQGFSWADQVRTARWLAEHKGPVILSNQATDRIVTLYRDCGFALKFVDAPRMISCNGDRTRAREVLAFKNLKP